MAKRKDDFEKYLEKQLKNSEFREEYKRIESLYSLIKKEIDLLLQDLREEI